MRPNAPSRHARRAFTLVELITLLAALSILITITALSGCCFPALGKARQSARQLKCSTQVRGITQAFVVWASNNQSMYPLPSAIDAKNQTVADPDRVKDSTANILSLAIFNGMISTDICVCPGETSSRISNMANYSYANPKAAVTATMALWDPAFSADFVAGTGNDSYAHLQPSGDHVPEDEVASADPKAEPPAKPGTGKSKKLVWTGRMSMWQDTYNSAEAIVADRAPQVTGITALKGGGVKAVTAASITTGTHPGGPGTWNGNVAYNDNHVAYRSGIDPAPGEHTYLDKAGTKTLDTIFYDEPNDPGEINTFLGIFTKAGPKPSNFKPIWD